MKRFLSFLAAASLLVGFTACSDHDPEPDPIPPTKEEVIKEIFPGGAPTFVANESAAAEEAQPGEAVALPAFNAAYKWTMKVDEVASVAAKASFSREGEAAGPFLLSFYANGDGATTELAGAGDGKEVQVYLITPEKAPIDGDISANVTLTMETSATTSETYTLYKAYVGVLDLHFTLEGVQFANGEWLYGEEGLAYEEIKSAAEDEESAIELYWIDGGSWYMRPIRIAADFDFEVLSAPEWLTFNNENTQDGVYTAWLWAATTKIAEPAGKIVFRHKEYEEVTLEYNITIPNYGEIFDMAPGGTVSYDAEGNQLESSTGAWFSVTEGKGYYFYKVTETSGSYYSPEGDWLQVEFTDTEEDDNALVRTIRPEITVSANESYNEREAVIVYVPSFAPEKVSYQGIEADLSEILEDGNFPADFLDVIAEYVFATVKQAGQEKPEVAAVLAPEDPSLFNNADAIVFFSEVEAAGWWPTTDPSVAYYQLIYNDKWSYEDGGLTVSDEYLQDDIEIAYYDADANELEEDEEFNGLDASIVTSQITGKRNLLKIDMDGSNSKWKGVDYAHEGFVTLSQNGKTFACVYCIYDETYQYEGGDDTPGDGGSDELVSFVNEEGVYGASLTKVTESNLDILLVDKTDEAERAEIEANFAEYTGSGTTIYCLNYYMDEQEEATLNVPAGLQVAYQPYSKVPWLSSNIAEYERTTSTMDVKMAAPGADDAKIGMIQLFEGSNSAPKIIIYCKPTFALL